MFKLALRSNFILHLELQEGLGFTEEGVVLLGDPTGGMVVVAVAAEVEVDACSTTNLYLLSAAFFLRISHIFLSFCILVSVMVIFRGWYKR